MTELHRRLGRNFTLGELLASETAERNPDMLKEQHNPPPEVVANLAYLVGVTLQPIRETLNFPIRVGEKTLRKLDIHRLADAVPRGRGTVHGLVQRW